MSASVLPGMYRHYKGAMYEVLTTATHTETGEVMVVYRALYGEQAYWIRPAIMFVEHVILDGVAQPRFMRVES